MGTSTSGCGAMIGKSRYTLNPETIRRWVEERGGRPAVVKARSRGDYAASAPRIDFPQYRSTGVVQRISWDQFFQKFNEKRLAFVYQERTQKGQMSRYFKIVSRDSADMVLPREPVGSGKLAQSRLSGTGEGYTL